MLRRHHLLLASGLALYAAGSLVPAPAGMALRLAGVTLFLVYALQRRSLTTWIFFGMLAGVELGLDAPHVAISLHVLSDIFLRLIKVIVAPLIFGTLVTGICGHGQLRSVGRLGLKALLYFEVLTTIALVIGLVAINVSKAGVGLTAAPAPHIVKHQLIAQAN